VVSDFGLVDAIESGLVKIPQMPVRDATGAQIASYFNIWNWILPKLTPAETGGARGSPKPEAILKFAHHPVAILGGLWEKGLEEWQNSGSQLRPPVFIIVCKNTRIAKVVYEWFAEDKAPLGIPSANIAGFRNSNGKTNTIRVDSKVVHETDTGGWDCTTVTHIIGIRPFMSQLLCEQVVGRLRRSNYELGPDENDAKLS
jgi:type III restriction enzyme